MKEKSNSYEPSSLVRKAASSTPFDQTKITPTKAKGCGKLGGLGKQASGGAMQGGGKRRSKGM